MLKVLVLTNGEKVLDSNQQQVQCQWESCVSIHYQFVNWRQNFFFKLFPSLWWVSSQWWKLRIQNLLSILCEVTDSGGQVWWDPRHHCIDTDRRYPLPAFPDMCCLLQLAEWATQFWEAPLLTLDNAAAWSDYANFLHPWNLARKGEGSRRTQCCE